MANTRHTLQPQPQPTPAPAGPERRTASPLLWVLLLLALLAFGWWIYNQRQGVSIAPEPLPPREIDIGDGQDAAAERERADDDARRATRAPREDRERRPAPDTPPPTDPDRDATPLARIQPDYPIEAYRRREQGTVLLGASIDADGRLLDVQVLRRSGSRELDQAAMDAVRQWTFEPAIRDGKAVASEVQVPVTFRRDP